MDTRFSETVPVTDAVGAIIMARAVRRTGEPAAQERQQKVLLLLQAIVRGRNLLPIPFFIWTLPSVLCAGRGRVLRGLFAPCRGAPAASAA